MGTQQGRLMPQKKFPTFIPLQIIPLPKRGRYLFFYKCLKIWGLLLELQSWPHRLAARTLASHAGNRGSIPLGATLTQ